MDGPRICLDVCSAFASHTVSDCTHHFEIERIVIIFSKHPLTILTVGAVKELLVYLWIQRGFYQSQTVAQTASSGPHVAFNDFPVKDVSVMLLLLFSQLSWKPPMKMALWDPPLF